MNRKEEIEKLEKRLAELKSQPDFEVGKWYKHSTFKNSLLVYNNGGPAYGFWQGEWGDKWFFTLNSKRHYTEATQEEVESALIKEAEKRGFKEGVRIKCSGINKNYTHSCDTPISGKFYLRDCGRLDSNSFGYIFEKGKWAEIIEEPKVVINGYEMKQDGDIISFGCAELDSCGVQDLLEGVEWFSGKNRKTNRKIKSITLDSGVEITVQQLKQIVKNIK